MDKKDDTPLDGQIDIGELFVREEETPKDAPPPTPIEGQLSFDDVKNSAQNKEMETEDRKALDDFLEEEKPNDRKELDEFFSDDVPQKDTKTIESKKSIKEQKMRDDDKFDDEYGVLGKDDYDGLIVTSFDDDFENNEQENTKSTPSKKSPKPKEIDNSKFFENDENAAIRGQVDKINKDFEEVKTVVGHSVFADVENSPEIKSKIDIEQKVYYENSGEKIEDGLLLKNLDTVLHESMIPYSEHVIIDRALPRVEDGLKPVQRRILYTMYELGLTPDQAFKKSARIVGECLGKFHPHGDSSVYDAMVRLAQPFNCNEVLVSGHGNFGSVDGDSAAAMRYTEARLAPLAMELLRDIDKNTVKWGLNFDDTTKEPEILPGRFPNLLVNGTSGIAVGLATNIPPHNLAECIDGVVAFIDNPKITLKEMLKIIKGPDFPTGGYILDNSEIMQAYETGRGKIYMRAKMFVEDAGGDKKNIVITDLPYQVNKASLLQKIAQLKDEGKAGFEGIAEIRDESDRMGQRAVIRLKKDVSANKVYAALLKNTELQCTFGINMVAIAGGKPKQMGLLDIISYYSEYQREVVLRRSKYDLEGAKEREHILSGLIIAINNIDAVVKIIKTSKNTQEAKARLKEKFDLSDKQTQAILDMRLARLTSLEVNKLEDEIKRLRELIKELTAVVSSTKKQYEIVKKELLEIKKLYKKDRRTKYLKVDDKLHTEEEEKKENEKEVVILKTALENFKCVPIRQYNSAQREIKEGANLSEIHTLKLVTTSNSTILGFTSKGNCIKVSINTMGECRYRDKGQTEWAVFKELDKGEHIIAIFDEKVVQEKNSFLFLTKLGMIKKTACEEYNVSKKNFQAIKLKDDDEVLSVCLEPKVKHTAIFVTRDGMVLNAKLDDVPSQGRVSGGVKGMAFTGNDFCIMASIALDSEGEVLVVSEKGYAKRTVVSSIDESVRYRKGLRLFSPSKESGITLMFSGITREEEKILCVVDDKGEMRFKPAEKVSIVSRTDKCKPFDKSLKSSLKVTSCYLAII